MKKIFRIDVANDAPRVRLINAPDGLSEFYGQDFSADPRCNYGLFIGELSKPAAANQICGVLPGGFAVSRGMLPVDSELFYVYESLSSKYTIITPQGEFVFLNPNVFEDEMRPDIRNVLMPDFRIFRLKSERRTDMFFCRNCEQRNGGFMDVYEELGLKGLAFTEVWRNE